MSKKKYIPLALKHRPKTFEDFVYNEPIKSILKSMIIKQQLPNGIIFSGTRGIGKTTLARLLARSVNCEKRPKKSHEPCGSCDSCKEALQGSHPDIIEIDGATHGSIEDIRKILEQAAHTPLMGGMKIFIIDEAHNLGRSTASWDSLLKVLEEPPDHVMWIFCTTQKQKIPDTIKSRLVSLDLKMVPTNELTQYLYEILAREGLDRSSPANLMPEDVCKTLSLAANNSVRDALTLLEKVIPYCNEKGWTKQNAQEALGVFDLVKVPEILYLIASHQKAELWAILNSILESGVDVEELFNALARVVNDIMTIYLGGEVAQPDVYLPYMEYFPVGRIIHISDVIFKRSRDLYTSSNKKMVMQVVAIELAG